MILHLLAKSPVENALFDRMGRGDGILLQSANVWLASKEHHGAETMQRLQRQLIKIYVLIDDLQLFGLDEQQLLSDVQVISMEQMVELTISYSVIKTWR